MFLLPKTSKECNFQKLLFISDRIYIDVSIFGKLKHADRADGKDFAERKT